MAEYILNQYVEIKAYTYLDNQLGINVHYGYLDAMTAGPVASAAGTNAISTYMAGLLKPIITSAALYLGVSVRQSGGGIAGPWATVWSKTAQGYGTGGADPLPKQATGLFTKITPIGGRSGRGRTYVPFPSTTDCEPDGNPTAAYIVKLNSYATAVSNVRPIPGLFDIRFGLMRWNTLASFKAVTDYSSRDRFATQRRRGDYGRVNAIPPQLV